MLTCQSSKHYLKIDIIGSSSILKNTDYKNSMNMNKYESECFF